MAAVIKDTEKELGDLDKYGSHYKDIKQKDEHSGDEHSGDEESPKKESGKKKGKDSAEKGKKKGGLNRTRTMAATIEEGKKLTKD